MAIVIASMIGIVLLAVGVLVLAFTMHVVSRSPRLRRATRRSALAAAAALYTARRVMARCALGFARVVGRRVGPVVAAVEARVQPMARNAVGGASAWLSRFASNPVQSAESSSATTLRARGTHDDDEDASERVPVGAAARR